MTVAVQVMHEDVTTVFNQDNTKYHVNFESVDTNTHYVRNRLQLAGYFYDMRYYHRALAIYQEVLLLECSNELAQMRITQIKEILTK